MNGLGHNPVSLIAGFSTGTLIANYINTTSTMVIPLWMVLVFNGLLVVLFDYFLTEDAA